MTMLNSQPLYREPCRGVVLVHLVPSTCAGLSLRCDIAEMHRFNRITLVHMAYCPYEGQAIHIGVSSASRR